MLTHSTNTYGVLTLRRKEIPANKVDQVSRIQPSLPTATIASGLVLGLLALFMSSLVLFIQSSSANASVEVSPSQWSVQQEYQYQSASPQSCIVGNFTATDVPKTICDLCTGTSVLNIHYDGSLNSLSVTGLNINHPKIGDLEVSLTSPSGTTVILIDNVCGNSANIPGIRLGSGPQIGSVCPPQQGSTYSPSFPLTPFINTPIIGVWTLTIRDQVAGGSGTLTSWGLFTVSSCPPTPTPIATLTPLPTQACFPSWKAVNNPNPPTGNSYPLGISAVSPTDIWLVGYNEDRSTNPFVARTLVEHWDGSRWDIVPSLNVGQYSSRLADVAAVSANDVWAVGQYEFRNPFVREYHALIEHWNGSTWSIVPNPVAERADNQLIGIEAVSANDIWAVGGDRCCPTPGGAGRPLTLHWDGVVWRSVPVPESIEGYLDPLLSDVTAISTDDVWAVGQRFAQEESSRALFLHWDGTLWNIVPSPNPGQAHNRIASIDAVSSDDVWAVGSKSDSSSAFQSLLLHWDGTNWSEVPGPHPGKARTDLYGVAALSTNDVWAAGSYWDGPGTVSQSMLLHWDGERWSVVPTALPISILGPVEAIGPADIWTAGYDTQGHILSAHYGTGFADVPTTHTFYSQVSCLECMGIISGYSDGTFRPNNEVTRGQLAKIVSNAAGFTESPDPQIFEDVPPDNTFYQWINRLTRRGHMSGYLCGGPGEPCTTGMPYFRPFANATRGQTSKIVSNAAGYTEIPTDRTFEDVPAFHTFYREIQRLASRNIMGGYPCGGPGEPCVSGRSYFRHANNVTRGQSAKIVANTFYPDCQTP